MKKFLKILVCFALLPLLFLSACDEESIQLKTTSTTETANHYLYNYSKDMVAFQSLTNDFTKNLTAVDSALLSSNIWASVNATNTEFLFALSAFDMKNKTSWFYDLSAVHPTLENARLDYKYSTYSPATSTRENDRIKTYYMNFDGTTPNSVLPITQIKNNDNLYRDDMDRTIATWGNNISFDVKYNATSLSYLINIKTAFAYPSAMEVPEKDTTNLKIIRNDQAQTITTIYVDGNGNTRTKEVNFSTRDTNNNIIKLVRYYEGDKIANPTLETTHYYYYEFNTDTSTILGTYEFLFNIETSYFQGKHTISTGVYHYIETYILEDGYVLADYDIINKLNNTSIKYLISSDASNAKLKYELKDKNESIDYIKNFKDINLKTFAKITNSDKKQTNKIVEYSFANGEIDAESIGY